MKKPLTILAFAFAFAAVAAIETRPVTFTADEIPATNPRVEKADGMTTHIELFAPFRENGDGSVSTRP